MKIRDMFNRLRGNPGDSGGRGEKSGFVGNLVATIAVTYRCQLHCDHCGSGRYEKAKEKELSTDEVKAAIRGLAEVGACSISFFGGEPLLRKDLCELISYARGCGLGTALDTNAVGITPEYAAKLADAGLNMIHISLDSARPEVHDRHRKTPGLFNKAVEAIRYSKETGMDVRIGTYVDREKLNNGDMRELLDLGRELGVVVRILSPVLSGRWLDREEVKLTQEEIKRFKGMLKKGESFWEQENCSGADDPFICSARTKENIYVTAYGDVMPCVYVPMPFGNIRQEPLEKIIRRMWKHEMFDCKCGTDCLMNDKKFREKHFPRGKGTGDSPTIRGN